VGAIDPSEPAELIQSLEAEQSVIGALLLNNDVHETVIAIVSERDFSVLDHVVIFRAINDVIAAGSIADVITVFDRLTRTAAKIKQPLKYLNEIAQKTPGSAGVKMYAEIVRDRSLRRALVKTCHSGLESVHKRDGRPAGEVIDTFLGSVTALAEHGVHRRHEFQSLNDILHVAVLQVEEAYSREDKDEPSGLSTGYVDLDRQLDGLHPGELIILAARPSMGKTSLAMNIVENVGARRDRPVNAAVFSLEMPSTDLAKRLIASSSRINSHRLRTGRLTDEDWVRLTHGISRLADCPVHILDEAAVTPSAMRARLRKMEREKGPIGLVVVDYLQIMGSDRPSDNRTLEITQISGSLKAIAKDFNCPVIALSQLNRGLENRTNKRPVMADLRESGAIEQDADVILFIYRDEVYNPDSDDRGTAEIIISKQRNGSIGTVRMTFEAEFTKFSNFADPSAASA
jgi:replicative DNA helicase